MTKKEIMVRAWELAKEGVKVFGGKVKEYFNKALAIAWEEAKTVVSVVSIETVAKHLNENGIHRSIATKANIWIKNDMRRIYVTVEGCKGYYQFNDTDNQITKKYIDCGYNYKLKGEFDAFAELFNQGEVRI